MREYTSVPELTDGLTQWFSFYNERRPRESLLEVVEKTVRAVELERHLRDEDKIYVVHGQRGVGGDEAGMASHQLDESDTVGCALGLDVGGVDGVHRAREGRLRVDAVFFQNLRDGEDRANADFTHATLRVGRHGLRNKLRAHRQTLDGIHDHAAILAEIARR